MNILILGSEGFIGRYLIDFYLLKGYVVYGCDLLETKTNNYHYCKTSLLAGDAHLIFSSQKFDICINAAGSGNVGFSITQPLSDFDANVSAVANVLNLLRLYNTDCKYLHISSAAVYGNPEKLPINEVDRTIPLSPYGFHKLMSEILCEQYYRIYQIKSAIIRPFSVYGPGLRKQFFWDTVQKLKISNDIELWGTGEETRDFIYISDLIDLIDIVVQKGVFKADIYNAASGVETSIKEVANLFLENLSPKTIWSFNQNQKPGDPINWRADISKVVHIGFEPRIGIEQGIELLTNWFKVNE